MERAMSINDMLSSSEPPAGQTSATSSNQQKTTQATDSQPGPTHLDQPDGQKLTNVLPSLANSVPNSFPPPGSQTSPRQTVQSLLTSDKEPVTTSIMSLGSNGPVRPISQLNPQLAPIGHLPQISVGPSPGNASGASLGTNELQAPAHPDGASESSQQSTRQFSLPPIHLNQAIDRRRQLPQQSPPISQPQQQQQSNALQTPLQSLTQSISQSPPLQTVQTLPSLPSQVSPQLMQTPQQLQHPHSQSSHQQESPPLRAEEAVARAKKNIEGNGGEEKRGHRRTGSSHHHHHHHHHRHHKHQSTSSSSRNGGSNSSSRHSLAPVPPTLKAEVIVDSSDVKQVASTYHAGRLSPLVYTGSRETLLPRNIVNKINYTIDLRIPYRFLNPDGAGELTKYNAGAEAVAKRKVWGTDIYTDDSDIIAVLHHTGDIKADSVPVADCSVTIRLLPTLEKYMGSYRNDYNSRSWLTRHDGISFVVEKVRFVPLGWAESGIVLRKRRLNEWMECKKQARGDLYQEANKFVEPNPSGRN